MLVQLTSMDPIWTLFTVIGILTLFGKKKKDEKEDGETVEVSTPSATLTPSSPTSSIPGIDDVGELGVSVALGVDTSTVSPSSFSSFFFFPNRVSIPITVKRVQIGSILVSWTSIRSTHFC